MKEFVYKIKVNKGANKINIRMGTEYNEAEQSVEFYYNTMEVKLDMEEIDGKIKSSKSGMMSAIFFEFFLNLGRSSLT